MLTQFDEQAQKAIVVAESIAFDLGHHNVGSEHLLLSLLKLPESQLRLLLKDLDVTESIIEEDIKRLFGISDDQPFYMEYSDVVKKILEESVALAQNKGKGVVTLPILSISLLQCHESVACELMKKYEVDVQDLIYVLSESSEIESKLDALTSLVNVNKKMKERSYQIIGRDQEIEQLCTILSKKEKNNVLIIGEAGVGKSALVEKLASLINQKQVPENLKRKIIYELSLSSLVAGTKYRGEFEEKLKKIVDKVKDMDNVIIFIDEIHNLIGAGGAEGAIDAANILKPYLARGDMTIIGATTLDEYYRHFEHDQAMNRRFSIMTLKENTKEETYHILLEIKDYFESYHQLKISEKSLTYLLNLVDRYIKNRTYPDKAIDILDLACVKAKFYHQQDLSFDVIKKVVKDYTSIQFDEDIHYHDIEKALNEKIKGQKQAIASLVHQLQIPKYNKPQLVCLLTGKSGVGKSETARLLAKLLHRHFIRLDMAQYHDSTSVQKIIGAPPGYVGYDKPSLLLPQLQSYPQSLLLLDDIEKAHPDVLNLFLQIFDEGYIEDNQKRKVFFDQTLIILTSHIQSGLPIGFKKSHSQKSLKDYFSDTFLNRMDEIITYQDLNKETLKDILHHQFPYLKQEDMIYIINHCNNDIRTAFHKAKKFDKVNIL